MQSSNVLQLNLTIPSAKKLVRELAEDTCRVFFSKHAEQRMKERKITRTQIIRCLLKGEITEGPARGTNGNWQLSMKSYSAGVPITVAMALDYDENGNHILVITVY